MTEQTVDKYRRVVVIERTVETKVDVLVECEVTADGVRVLRALVPEQLAASTVIQLGTARYDPEGVKVEAYQRALKLDDTDAEDEAIVRNEPKP